MKKFICLILLLSMVLALAACGGVTPTTTEKKTTPDNTTTPEEKYNVYFEGASMPAMSVVKDTIIQRPKDPSDTADSQFVNWYTDASYTTLATFPMTVREDTKLYAKYLSFKDYFLMAREDTVGEDISGFEYSYQWEIAVTVPVVGKVNGLQKGTSKYSSTGEVGFFDHRTNSGLLFNNGQIYEYNNGATKNIIELDENGKIVDFASETDTSHPKYTSSGMAKALFTYTDKDIKSIAKSGNTYVITTKTNASGIGKIILNNINNPMVEKTLDTNLPNIESDATVKVTYQNGKIASYEYQFTVDVSAVNLSVTYRMDFQKVDEIPTVTLPTFDNFHITETKINECLTAINTAVSAYKTAENSADTVTLKTAVDFGLSTNAIDATISGESKRSNHNGAVDFINLIEIDSDLKNDDLYKHVGLKDIKFVTGNLTDGTIYDREKKLIGYGDPTLVDDTDRKTADAYYLLLDDTFFTANHINSVSLSTTSTSKAYSLTLTKAGAFALFEAINQAVTLNPFVDADIKVLGDYNKDTLSISKISFVIELDKSSNALLSMKIKLDSECQVKYTDSKDFADYQNAAVSVDLSFTVTAATEPYTAPAKASDLKY